MFEKGELFTAILAPGGYGKSYLIKKKIEEDPSFAVLTASTGIAAINLNGRTINSLLGYFNTNDLLYKVANGGLLDSLLEVSKRFKNIVIDECSMIPSQQLDLICRAIEDHNRYVNSSHKIKGNHNELSIILLGDPGQLPAVSKPSTQGRYDEEFEGDLKGIQDTPAKPFFMAKYWGKFTIHQLTEVKRQTDKEFVEKLMLIREGKVKEVVNWFEENVGFNNKIDDNFIGSTFFPTNKEVDNYNNLKLKQLPTEVVKFDSQRKGKQLSDWKNIPESLYIKTGCKVMLLCNNFTAGYANGELGYVEETLADSILVRLQRNDRVVLIEPKFLENTINCKNTKTDKYFTKIVGTISYLPVRQGDAASIHKCQGLTLDNVQIDLNHWFLSTLSGGLYTALSRVTNYKGLRLVGSRQQFIKACYINPKCLEFIKYLKDQINYENAA